MRILNYFFYISAFFSPSMVYTQNQKNVKNHSFVNDRSSLITGRILNYTPNENNQFITFRSFGLNGNHKDTSIYIDKGGYFSVNLIQDFEGDFAFLYRRDEIDLYYIPGEKLHIEIDESKWMEPEKKKSSLLFSGKAAMLSKLIADFTNAYYKEQFSAFNWFDSTLSDEVRWPNYHGQ